MTRAPQARSVQFDVLQRDTLQRAWLADLPDSGIPHVLVALPSFALDRTVYDHYGDRVPPLENRFLYALLRARERGTEVVYLSSVAVPDATLDGYLSLLSPGERKRVMDRSRLVSADDASWRPLAEKLLDRGDIVDWLRSHVRDRVAILEPWNIGPAEEALSVALGVPANGTGTSNRHLASKSNGRSRTNRRTSPRPPRWRLPSGGWCGCGLRCGRRSSSWTTASPATAMCACR